MEYHVQYVDSRKNSECGIKKILNTLPCAKLQTHGKKLLHTAKFLICRVPSQAHGKKPLCRVFLFLPCVSRAAHGKKDLCRVLDFVHTANYHFPVVRPTHSSLIESQSPSRIGALWIVIVIWSSPSHPPLLADSCAHRLPARLGLASHTYPPRWHAVRHGFVFLGASLLYYSCCMRDETGEHVS